MTLTLTTFIPGTKAKADEVNANFSAIQQALNEKAAIDGDGSQTFAVAQATDASHAINKSQLDNLSDNLNTKINKTGTKFCVKSGNTTDGKGDLFTANVYEITAKIAGAYKNLVITDYQGLQTTISSTPDSINLSGNVDGEYNIFITPEGELYILDNTIYVQAKRPAMIVGDIWLNTSCEPFECIKYSGSSDAEFLDVPLGKVSFKNNAITFVETFSFNQNRYNLNSQSTMESGTKLAESVSNLVMPDYMKGVAKSFSTVYNSSEAGYLYVLSRFSGTFYISSGNADVDSTNYTWKTFTLNGFADQGYSSSNFFPIPKDMYYKVVVGGTSGSVLTFFPSLA